MCARQRRTKRSARARGSREITSHRAASRGIASPRPRPPPGACAAALSTHLIALWLPQLPPAPTSIVKNYWSLLSALHKHAMGRAGTRTSRRLSTPLHAPVFTPHSTISPVRPRPTYECDDDVVLNKTLEALQDGPRGALQNQKCAQPASADERLGHYRRARRNAHIAPAVAVAQPTSLPVPAATQCGELLPQRNDLPLQRGSVGSVRCPSGPLPNCMIEQAALPCPAEPRAPPRAPGARVHSAPTSPPRSRPRRRRVHHARVRHRARHRRAHATRSADLHHSGSSHRYAAHLSAGTSVPAVVALHGPQGAQPSARATCSRRAGSRSAQHAPARWHASACVVRVFCGGGEGRAMRQVWLRGGATSPPIFSSNLTKQTSMPFPRRSCYRVSPPARHGSRRAHARRRVGGPRLRGRAAASASAK